MASLFAYGSCPLYACPHRSSREQDRLRVDQCGPRRALCDYNPNARWPVSMPVAPIAYVVGPFCVEFYVATSAVAYRMSAEV